MKPPRIKGLIVTYSRFVYKLFHTEKSLRILRLLFSRLHPSAIVVRVSPDCIIAGPYNFPRACSYIEISPEPMADYRRGREAIEPRLYYSYAGNPFSEDHVVYFRNDGEDDGQINFEIPATLKGKKDVWLRLALPKSKQKYKPINNIGQFCAHRASSIFRVTNKPLRGREIEVGPFGPYEGPIYIDMEIELNIPRADTALYDYSKLYYRTNGHNYSEKKVLCFRVVHNYKKEYIRIKIPPISHSEKELFFRVDGLPYIKGQTVLHSFRPAVSPQADDRLRVLADYNEKKRITRSRVRDSESRRLSSLPHYPESLSIELTAGCNLTCGHCSSHGSQVLHTFHNSLKEFDSGDLTKLAEEVFPYLTSITLVGRGEPTFISHSLWNQLFDYAEQYNVLISLVTNGLSLQKRLKPRHLTQIDTVTLSIDGNTPETMSTNRGGAELSKVLNALEYYCDIRRKANLARRPRLSLSWTLKRNNIAEFPDFISRIVKYEPDLIYSRHLLVFHRKDIEESLLHEPELANKYLRDAYRIMRENGIPSDCPPIIAGVDSVEPPDSVNIPGVLMSPTSGQKGVMAREATDVTYRVVDVKTESNCDEKMTAQKPEEKNRCIYFRRSGVIMVNGSVTTCARPYARELGELKTADSFMDIWNGDHMVDCRASFGTSREWHQCSNCWYRESAYAGQRDARSARRSFDLTFGGSVFTKASWDFRSHTGGDLKDYRADLDSIRAKNI